MLPTETNFHVAIFTGDRVESIGGRSEPEDGTELLDTLTRLRAFVPRGGANLDAAFDFIDRPGVARPDRVVLITDGLPTAGQSASPDNEVTEAERTQLFKLATSRIPPRVPIQTILLPSSPGDPGAAGLYWQLAHQTRGGLSVPAKPGIALRTHIAFVIDTSGSMRDPNTGALWPGVINTIEAALDAQPPVEGVQILDGDGRFILGRRGHGAAAWLANTPETREAIRRVLSRYQQDSISNPVPGVANALRFLHDSNAPDMRMGIYLLGDEFNSSDPAGVALDRLDALNPRDASGRRAVIINAIGFPTTIRVRQTMGNTGLRFANLMRLIAQEHDGAFIGLAEL